MPGNAVPYYVAARPDHIAYHCMLCHVEWRARPLTEEVYCWSCGQAGVPGVYPSVYVSWSNPGHSPIYEEETD